MSAQIGRGFSLVMELQDPDRLAELMFKLDQPATKARVGAALASLDYVHFARFLPLWGRGLLLIVTEFDGEMRDYVTDFAVVLDDEFSLILSYMRDAPPLPVSRDPDAFWRYVQTHTRSAPGELLRYPDPFSAYGGHTVLELAGPGRSKRLPEPFDVERTVPDRKDVQANLLRGVRAKTVRHLFWRFPEGAEAARTLLRDLCDFVTADLPDRELCVTLGLTHEGLGALGLPHDRLQRFPQAFREGPRLRAALLGDRGASDPRHWRIGGFEQDQPDRPEVIHAMASLVPRAGAEEAAAVRTAELQALAATHGAIQVHDQTAAALDGGDSGPATKGKLIHFGYRDDLSNPRFALDPGADPAGLSPPGDLLLGTGWRSSRGNCYIRDLDPALATHGCYGAVRVIEQDVAVFEGWLDAVEPVFAAESDDRGLRRELAAAKLMGRWRDGTPLALHPRMPGGADAEPDLDAFDYAGGFGEYDDRDGRRCPFGAHIRRTNPRGGMVLGVPWGRRVVRRGLPYGPKWDPAQPDAQKTERGLFGLFLCADLEAQFEFIQKVWASGDLSAPGLRGTHDPFAAGRGEATPFRLRPHDDAAELTVTVPPLVRTRGSLYLFYPGLKGLHWLAQAGWAL